MFTVRTTIYSDVILYLNTFRERNFRRRKPSLESFFDRERVNRAALIIWQFKSPTKLLNLPPSLSFAKLLSRENEKYTNELNVYTETRRGFCFRCTFTSFCVFSLSLFLLLSLTHTHTSLEITVYRLQNQILCKSHFHVANKTLFVKNYRSKCFSTRNNKKCVIIFFFPSFCA